MRVIRRNARQGHAVPTMASAPNGPFPREIMMQSAIVFDDNDPDFAFPPSATAQNNYATPKIYRCSYCADLVPEYEIDFHECDEDDDYPDEREDDDG